MPSVPLPNRPRPPTRPAAPSPLPDVTIPPQLPAPSPLPDVTIPPQLPAPHRMGGRHARRPDPAPAIPARPRPARSHPAHAGAVLPVEAHRSGPRPSPVVPARPAAPSLTCRIRSLPASGTALLRDPRTVRRASMGTIAAGVAVFVVASVSAPLAGADSAAHREPRHGARTSGVSNLAGVLPLSAGGSAAASPQARRTLPRAPVHARTRASTSHGTISGLAANGIPNVALNAYRVAAARMANVEPSCGVDWALLAGIGREESDHGRFAGAVLHRDGISTPPIIGPALDGIHWDYVPAPGNGLALDGDAKYAHALGPMQFIPSTWAGYGADATGDGRADIFNINDAALGTARYLCAAGGNLRTHAGQVAGVLAYNHSDEYLAQVLALADAYRRGIRVSGIPVVGITKGKLPEVADTGYIPPANPAAPTAAQKAAAQKAAQKAAAQKAKAKAAAERRKKLAEASASASASASKSASKSASRTPSKPPSSTHAPHPSHTPTPTSSSPSHPTSSDAPPSDPATSDPGSTSPGPLCSLAPVTCPSP